MPAGTRANDADVHPVELVDCGINEGLASFFRMHIGPHGDSLATLAFDAGDYFGRAMLTLLSAVVDDNCSALAGKG